MPRKEPIQAVTYSAGPSQYRSFTELGRQVAAELNFTIDLESSEIYDSTGKKVADNIEILSMAMHDLGMIFSNPNATSPGITWGKVQVDNPQLSADRLRTKISSYDTEYWQHHPNAPLL